MTPITPLKPRTALLLAAVSAFFIGTSLTVSSAWPLGFIALTPWLIAAARVRPLLGFRLGVVVAVFGGLGFGYWLPGSLSSLLGIHPAWAWAGTVAISLLTLATFWGPFSLWVSWAARRGHFNPWLVAGAWSFCSYLYATGPIPWGLLSYSQPPGALILQIADVTGWSGVEAVLALTSALLACALVPRLRPNAFPVHLAVAAFLVTALYFYGSMRLAQDVATGPPMRVALVQPDLDPGLRWLPEFQQQNFEHHLTLSRTAEDGDPELILWPEFAIEVPLPANQRTLEALQAYSRETAAALIIGAPFGEPGRPEREGYNSAFLLRDGDFLGRYDKRKLVPITERNFLPSFIDSTPDAYRTGADPKPLRLNSTELGVTICWDAMYPDVFRRLARRGAGIMVNISRDERFESEVAARQILRAAALRAVESRRWMLRPTAGGFSAIVDARGNLVELAEYGHATVLQGQVYKVEGTTVYHQWGDIVPWIGGLAMFWPLRKRRRSRFPAENPRP